MNLASTGLALREPNQCLSFPDSVLRTVAGGNFLDGLRLTRHLQAPPLLVTHVILLLTTRLHSRLQRYLNGDLFSRTEMLYSTDIARDGRDG